MGYALPKIFWDDLKVEGRRVGAAECYNCHVNQVIDIGVEMADVLWQIYIVVFIPLRLLKKKKAVGFDEALVDFRRVDEYSKLCAKN